MPSSKPSLKSLCERYRWALPVRIRNRGRSYWREGQFELHEVGPRSVDAVVRGTDDYAVRLDWEPASETLHASCTCPYFEDRGELCKHVWTVLIEVDRTPHLAAAKASRSTHIAAREPSEAEGESDSSPETSSPEGWGLDWEDPDLEDPDLEDPDFEDADRDGPTDAPHGAAPPIRRRARPVQPTWRTHLRSVRPTPVSVEPGRAWLSNDRQLLYVVVLDPRRTETGTVIDLASRDRKKNGEWGALKPTVPRLGTIERLPDPADRRLLTEVVGARSYYAPGARGAYGDVPRPFVLSPSTAADWLKLAAGTGRLVRPGEGRHEVVPLAWDGDEPWRLHLEVRDDADGDLELSGELRRGRERMDLDEPDAVTPDGFVLANDRIGRLDDDDAPRWIETLRNIESIQAPRGDTEAFLETLFSLPRPSELTLPEALRCAEVQGEPRPRLAIGAAKDWWLQDRNLLPAHLEFAYEGRTVRFGDPRPGLYEGGASRFIVRDRVAESRASERLTELGVRPEAESFASDPPRLVVPERNLDDLVHALTEEGWLVEAEGRRFRRPESLDLELRSEIDWFNLEGEANFGGASAGLPALLKALRKGKKTVALGDGSVGLLPQEWLERFGTIARMGEEREEGIRFGSHQIGLLDALLAAEPAISEDRAVREARQRVQRFTKVRPKAAPKSFRGELRDYQERGLGWLHALRRIGFGACLADEMGLGKTVQVLALLESRRAARRRHSGRSGDPASPTLVVVPKSLLFNWQREAERFTPKMRILEHTGPKRSVDWAEFSEYDLVLTTYGTLRSDIEALRVLEFDYVVLDEAQAIKNRKSATAKAARLLRAAHRVALTGTPVENHVGELMSLLDFLNPGLFGRNATLPAPKGAHAQRSADTADPAVELVAGAVRPFILRRTKRQVADDLPDKIETTLYCELAPEQRKSYEELLVHYRNALLGRMQQEGLARSKIHVLEALLRLRQAACHAGLIDPARSDERSGKLDALLEHLDEVLASGGKALVFSQFTKMLAIVRSRLDERGVPYEYLDGRTRKREERVERFQSDPDVPVFLVSLKAGGVGLNLTAAEYVFLLDPWWNPAVEAQAIDRTHRIGQSQTVLAYSLIARDTVEEKILALQQSKRELAETVVRADESFLRNLTREELLAILS